MNISNVDLKSLVVDGIDTKDFPDFCDAYIAAGYYLDGAPLTEDVLDYLSETLNVNELAHNSLY